MKDIYREYGNIFLIKFDKDKVSQLDLLSYCSDKQIKVIVHENSKYLYGVVYQTYNRPAYEMYYDLMGISINKLETLSAGLLLDVFEDINIKS